MQYCSQCFATDAPFSGASELCDHCQEAHDEILARQEAGDTLALTPLEISDTVIACRMYSIQSRDIDRHATAKSYWLLAAKFESYLERFTVEAA